jgi:hypothetical protein
MARPSPSPKIVSFSVRRVSYQLKVRDCFFRELRVLFRFSRSSLWGVRSSESQHHLLLRASCLDCSSTPNMEGICSSETSKFLRTTQRCNLEDLILYNRLLNHADIIERVRIGREAELLGGNAPVQFCVSQIQHDVGWCPRNLSLSISATAMLENRNLNITTFNRWRVKRCIFILPYTHKTKEI